MRAAILHEFETPLTIEECTPRDVGPYDARVRIEHSGVCHTDLSVTRGGLKRPLSILLGHEGAGVVTAVGSDVTRVKVGDRVVASFVASCGNCYFCLHDESHLCEYMFSLMGIPKATLRNGTPVYASSTLGTFAQELTASETLLVKVNTDLPSEQLALIGCGVTTGVGAALNTAQVKPGASVAVFGCGGVGQSVIQGARIAGAARIFAVDPVASKREIALQLGATDVIDASAGDPVAQLREMTGGRGCDYTFEVTGLPQVILQAYAAARRGGTIVVVGMTKMDATIELSAFSLLLDGKKLIGSVYGSSQVRPDFPRLGQLAETGRLDLGALVSRQIALEGVNDALAAIESGVVIRSVIDLQLT
jgi:S-(hydroxymethyl)glutathione dehydrogenase / alcohol dehydrogenase